MSIYGLVLNRHNQIQTHSQKPHCSPPPTHTHTHTHTRMHTHTHTCVQVVIWASVCQTNLYDRHLSMGIGSISSQSNPDAFSETSLFPPPKHTRMHTHVYTHAHTSTHSPPYRSSAYKLASSLSVKRCTRKASASFVMWLPCSRNSSRPAALHMQRFKPQQLLTRCR